MGYNQREAKIVAFTDNHNSPRTRTDNALWDELMDRVNKAVTDPLFSRLNITFDYSLSDDRV